MKWAKHAVVTAIAAAVALVPAPSHACPATTVTCNTAVIYTATEYDNEAQCGLPWGYPGADRSFRVTPPAGQFVYVDMYVWAWRYIGFYWEPDVDLFLYAASSCQDWDAWGTCAADSWNSGLTEEQIDFVADGLPYHLVVDDYFGSDAFTIIPDYDVVMQVGCPEPCDPALDVEDDLTCSDTFTNQAVGTSDALDYYVCGTPYDRLLQTNPETIYTFTPQATGAVTFRLSNMTNDFDIYVLSGACDQSSCIASSTWESTLTDSVTFNAVQGVTYYIVIEAFSGGGTYDFDFDDGGGGCLEDCANGVDDDSNGLTDCLDPICCGDPVCFTHPACCDDADGDGFDAAICGGPDCDDTSPDAWYTHPGAAETCDGQDNDCDGTVDEGTTCYDDDGDGFTELSGDCNDASAGVRPGARESCNGVDDDCSGVIDDHSPCWDDDGDCVCEVAPCAGTEGVGCGPLVGGDCNDGDAAVAPGFAEVLGDGIDNDCDGSVDAGSADPDNDGYTVSGGDCMENDATVYPGAPEQADGVDDDCDGVIDEGTASYDDDGDGYCEGVDLDGDLVDDCADGSTPGDCDDALDAVNPDAFDDANGVDDDCDGQIDEGSPHTDDDGDGLSENEGDCDDGDANVRPGNEEVANDVDDDCDGDIDEGFQDVDGDGVTTADGDCDDEEGWVRPGLAEVCDGLDNDCNGEVDEGCDGEPGFAAGDPGGCGCASGGAPRGLWLGVFAAAGLLIRRRTAIAVGLGAVALTACKGENTVQALPGEMEAVEQVVDLGEVAVGRVVSFTVDLEHVAGPAIGVELVDVFNVEGDGFTFDGELPVVEVGGAASLDLVFAPPEAGYYRAAVTIESDAEASAELLVHVRGQGVVPDGAVWPLLLDFGRMAPPDSGELALTVANVGDADMEITDLLLTDTDVFSVVQAVPVTVAAGTTEELTVVFAPIDDDPRVGSLRLELGPAVVLGPVALHGNACAFGNPVLYDVDGDGFTDCGGDCDDDALETYPGAPELLDGEDQDCDGVIDEGTDAYDDDGDCHCEAPPCVGSVEPGCTTLGSDADCHDGEIARSPDAAEIYGNGIDDDCDGVVDLGTTDDDGDGYGPGGGDCDDADPTVYPGAPELPDSQDNNCDGLGPSGTHIADEGTVLYDDDGDGYCETTVFTCTFGIANGDCDDRVPDGASTYPTAPELVDGRDNDCDNDVDEGTTAFDDDGDGFTEQGGDCDDGNPAVHPAHAEVPGNGVNDDCNGATPD